MPKVRVHWTLPERQIEEIARRAEIADRSEPYIVERMIDFALDNGFDITSGQAQGLDKWMKAHAKATA